MNGLIPTKQTLDPVNEPFKPVLGFLGSSLTLLTVHPISADKSYTKNVDNTIQNVKNSTGNLMNKAKNWMNSKQGQAAAQEAKNWFERFIDWIKSLFGWN